MEKSTPTPNHRIGVRYFPDTIHFRESDLGIWLPELTSLGTKWIVLETPIDRAIPESFLCGLIKAGIQPILQMRLPLNGTAIRADLTTLLQVYASWGLKYLCPIDQPNTLQAWGDGSWVQQKLVSRFLDRFIPIAEQISQAGLQPVFPALAPGGNFWDTVFLRSSLQGIKDRGHTRLLESMVIGAYAWPGNHPLDWGKGGPQAWPHVHPYDTPENQQDHLGFRIFDWYSQISEKVIGKPPQIILLGTGAQMNADTTPEDHAAVNIEIAAQLGDYKIIPQNVLAACFSILAAESDHPLSNQAWYPPGKDQQPIVAQFKEKYSPVTIDTPELAPDEQTHIEIPETTLQQKPIKHYLLLPHPRWGNPDWFLKATRSFVKKYAPTTGYSIREAFFARRVTIIGGVQVFPENLRAELEKQGSEVLQITGSGTEIATQLAEL
ncbi:MAG: hypothetical protein JW757_09425 [Anaerolineales bacterium]|nr:hypothetical protein [Anaerolineales bacterium]